MTIPNTTLPDKAHWRQTIEARGPCYDVATLQAASRRILEEVERLPAFVSARVVALYWSLPKEVDTHDFVERWSHHKQVLLPVMAGQTLELAPFVGREALVCRRFGVYEPDTMVRIDPEAVELIVVPGVGFDPHGGRLGHGKGFYDRLLPRMTACKVGVCFDFQLLDSVPMQPHDIPMDWVICGSAERVTCFAGTGQHSR